MAVSCFVSLNTTDITNYAEALSEYFEKSTKLFFFKKGAQAGGRTWDLFGFLFIFSR